MGGGSHADNKVDGPNIGLDQLNAYTKAKGTSGVQDILSKVSTGQLSIQDALKQAGALKSTGIYDDQISKLRGSSAADEYNKALDDAFHMPGMYKDSSMGSEMTQGMANGYEQSNTPLNMGGVARDALATDPITGSLLAKDAVMNDPTLKGLFGNGGLQSQAEGQYTGATKDLVSDRQALMGRDQSYGLTPQDLQAYGQASDSIARMFGAQGNSLAQALSDRGLGAAPSGVAAQGFSNLMGNQAEQLQSAQFNIAQNRVNTAMQLANSRANLDLGRQSQAGQLATNLGSLGQSAISNQFNRQLAGSENNYNQMAGAAGMQLQNDVAAQNQANIAWAQDQQSSWNPLKTFGTAAAGSAGGALGYNLGGGPISSIAGSAGKAAAL